MPRSAWPTTATKPPSTAWTPPTRDQKPTTRLPRVGTACHAGRGWFTAGSGDSGTHSRTQPRNEPVGTLPGTAPWVSNHAEGNLETRTVRCPATHAGLSGATRVTRARHRGTPAPRARREPRNPREETQQQSNHRRDGAWECAAVADRHAGRDTMCL